MKMSPKGMGTDAIRAMVSVAESSDAPEFDDGVATTVVFLNAARHIGPGRAINLLHDVFGVDVSDAAVDAANDADATDAAQLDGQIVRAD